MSSMDDSMIDTLLRSGDETAPAELRNAVAVRVRCDVHLDDDQGEPLRRRLVVGMSAAAAIVVLIAGLAVVGTTEDDRVPATNTTVPVTGPSTAAVTTLAESPTSVPTASSPTEDATISYWSAGLIDDIDESSLRPLSTLAAGDVVVPTAPSGWRVIESASVDPVDAFGAALVEAGVNFAETANEPLPGPRSQESTIGGRVSVWVSREWRCLAGINECQARGSATIDGAMWEWYSGDFLSGGLISEFTSGETLRTRVGDRWVTVTLDQPYPASDWVFDDPFVIEVLEGLRAGRQDVLNEVGDGQWLLAPGVEVPEFSNFDGAQTPFGPLAPSLLRPLASMTAGDILFPTAHEDWVWDVFSDGFLSWPGGVYRATPGDARITATDGRYLEVIVGPACDIGSTDPGATLCGVREGHPTIYWPLGSETEIGGVTWGYSNDDSGNIAAIVGDYAVLIADRNSGLQSPLLSDPDVVEFLEGLRVASAIDVAELFAGATPP